MIPVEAPRLPLFERPLRAPLRVGPPLGEEVGVVGVMLKVMLEGKDGAP